MLLLASLAQRTEVVDEPEPPSVPFSAGPLEIPYAIDYLDAVWKAKTGSRLFVNLNSASVAHLTQPCGGDRHHGHQRPECPARGGSRWPAGRVKAPFGELVPALISDAYVTIGLMLPPLVPDLIALELLDSVAELGSLGRAAGRHGMSQPAVSQRMAQLERDLGLALLQRSRTGSSLTPAGERVAVLARRVLSEAHVLMAGVAAVVAEEGNHLRVAASLTVAEYLLPGWLSALHRESPSVILAVEVANSSRVLARVRDGRADVGFVEGHEKPPGGMSDVVVRSDHLVVVVGRGHPWAERTSAVGGAELAAADLIVREPGSGTREVLDRALGSWGGARSWLELGSTASILAAARRGDAPAVLSALAVAEDLEAGRLMPVRTSGVGLSRVLRAVWRADRPLAPLAGRLLNLAAHKSDL